ncbi:MAG: site-specific integrase [Lachnospiraceae bacterium]|nr:site-specific integrase [Lachnospiraceae bacterium]
MNNEKGFWTHLRNYFTVYLPKQRRLSQNTYKASRQTWNLLLRYISNEMGIPLKDVGMETIGPDAVAGFLDYMAAKKGWKPSTRNQRLSMIRAFFTYAACMEPSSYIYLAGLSAIPLAKGIDTSFVLDYMSEEAMGALLHAPDTSKRNGIRDQFFMSLMYDSAARNCEMLSMKLSDFEAASSSVYLMGKGEKPRLVPVSKETVDYYHFYKSRFHSDSSPSDPMFYTVHKGKKTSMSDDNVARFMKQYADAARKTCRDIPERVHPHQFRKSRAMHLYQGGMPLPVLAEYLGHEDPETTLIYARADTEMKRKALEQTEKNHAMACPQSGTPIWDGDEDIIEKLCRGYA